jgi:membrane protease YdiL (CAAX protease family)
MDIQSGCVLEPSPAQVRLIGTVRVVVVFLAVIGLAALAGAATGAILLAHGGRYDPLRVAAATAIRETIALAATLLIGRRMLRVDRRDLGLTNIRWLDLAVAIVTAAASLAVGQLLVQILPYTHAEEFLAYSMGVGTVSGHIAALAVVGVYSPFVQEVVFRGLLLGGLRTRLGSPLAIGVSAIAYGLAHGQAGAAVVAATCVDGVLQGTAFVARRSLAAPVIAHILVNSTAILVAIQEVSSLHVRR